MEVLMENKMSAKVMKTFENYLEVVHDLDWQTFIGMKSLAQLGYYLDFLRKNDIWVNWNMYFGQGFEFDILDRETYHYQKEFKIFQPTRWEKAVWESIEQAIELLNKHFE